MNPSDEPIKSARETHAGGVDRDDATEASTSDCYAFFCEDSYPVGTIIKAIRSYIGRTELSDDTAGHLRVFLFALERLPLVTPGVHMTLGLRFSQDGESEWMEIQIAEDEFSLGRGTWTDGEACSETVFEVTSDYRGGDAFSASQFAATFAELAKDPWRTLVVEDFSTEPFSAWDLPLGKSHWSKLPCSFS